MFMKKIFKIESWGLRQKISGHKSRGVKGFTLIEIIITMLLVGVLAAVGGMAIVRAINGYVAVKENSAATQKAQMAMSRITREITEMINVYSAASNATLPITGASNCNSATDCVRTIGWDSGAIKIANGSGTSLASGDILINNVSSFNLEYWNRTTNATTWPTGNDGNLTAVKVDMTIARSDGTALPPFSVMVHPRNNGNLGGAPLPTTSYDPQQIKNLGWNCFVATAAYGNAAHPMVQILRDFRDAYLMNWPGGRWLIKEYYEHGPALADIIRNKPLAMSAVRCLLAPIVILAFCLTYAPLSIPFIILVSIIVTSAIFAACRRGFPALAGVWRSRGSILVSLIITMVIMAALGAAMLPMFSSSYMNEAYADQARKAYYLAESGFRYAAYLYRSASTDSAKNTALSNMNKKTYTLLSNNGSFYIEVFPFWSYTSGATGAGATSLPTTLYGTVPAEFGTSAAGYLKVGTGYYSYTGFSTGTSTITFSGFAASSPTTSVPAISSGTDVQLMAKTSGSTQTLSKNSNLTLASTGVAVLPTFGGNFTLVSSSGSSINYGRVFNYQKRVDNTLYNVTLSDPGQNAAWTSSVSVPASSNLVLSQFIRVTSTGNVGSTSRMVTYNAPVGMTIGGGFQKIPPVTEDMSSSANWETTSAMGGQSFNDAGSGAMRVSGMQDTSLGGFWGWLFGSFYGWGSYSGVWNLIEFNWANTAANLAQAWMDAQGFLNYDLQVKVKNTERWFFAGLNFRSNTDAAGDDFYTYGVSFVKPRQRRYCSVWLLFVGCVYDSWNLTTDQPANLIPGGASGVLFPGGFETSGGGVLWTYQYGYGQPAIVLWQRTSSGFKWLAYKTLQNGDGVVYNSGGYPRLTDWSTLLVRVSEGYSLTFTGGGGSTGGEIKEGDTITNAGGTKSARVVMTPILTSATGRKADWTNNVAAGTLVLANIPTPADTGTTFSVGEGIYVNGVQLATAGTFSSTKRNYIRVYFTDPTARGSANNTEVDSAGTANRKANARNSVNWPPDVLTELESDSSQDYVTLVQWTGYNTGVSAVTSTSQSNAIISTTTLVSPTWTVDDTLSTFVSDANSSCPGDSIGLMTASDAGTSTYYDDFSIQLDLNGGTSFMLPIQY